MLGGENVGIRNLIFFDIMVNNRLRDTCSFLRYKIRISYIHISCSQNPCIFFDVSGKLMLTLYISRKIVN